MLKNHAEYQYETPYKVPVLIEQCCTNVRVGIVPHCKYTGTLVKHHVIKKGPLYGV